MSIWVFLLAIGGAGAVGGLINALIVDKGLVLWRWQIFSDGSRVFLPGFVGNVVIGAVTAIVLAGLYSPLGAIEISGSKPVGGILTIGGLAGTFLSGIGGARILTAEVNKWYAEASRRDAENEKIVNRASRVRAPRGAKTP